MKRKPLPKGVTINKKGPLTTLWENFRAKKAVNERDEEGLLHCQDWRIGLPRCGIGRPELDLHHIIGREQAPSLYFHHPNLVWLTRDCHNAAHDRNPTQPSIEAENDPEGQMGAASSSSEVSPVQGRPSTLGARKPGRTVFSSVQSKNARFVERQEEGRI